MALWKARSLSPEQKVQLVEEESETKSLRNDENGSFIGLGDVSMSEAHSGALSVPVISLFPSKNYWFIIHFFVQLNQCLCFITVSYFLINLGQFSDGAI